ncbi:MAG: hypothetical protein G01um101466_570, partial [Parcubacteria group bacterium Gr01-1014_66]
MIHILMSQSRIVYISRRTERKKPQRVKRRRTAVFWIGIAFLTVVIAASGGVLVVTRISALQINEISVFSSASSPDVETVEEVTALALEGTVWGIIPKRFFLAISPEDIEEFLLKKFPRFSSVNVRVSGRRIEVSVQERQLFAVMCGGRAEEGKERLISEPPCAYVDTKGILYEQAPESSGNLILSIIRDTVLPPAPSPILDDSTLILM